VVFIEKKKLLILSASKSRYNRALSADVKEVHVRFILHGSIIKEEREESGLSIYRQAAALFTRY
jgi:hypothetical protein